MNQPVREADWLLPPEEQIVKAALEFADSDSDDDGDYEKRRRRLMAVARSLGNKGLTTDQEMMLTIGEQQRSHMKRIAKKGVEARMRLLSPRRRQKIARNAARARWQERAR